MGMMADRREGYSVSKARQGWEVSYQNNAGGGQRQDGKFSSGCHELRGVLATVIRREKNITGVYTGS